MRDTRSSRSVNSSEVHHRLGPYEVAAATDFGPRLIGLRRDESPQIFVELPPEISIDHPRGGLYRLRGGHRLWVSPEVPEITYAPDEHQCAITADVDSLTISAPADSAGFEKELHLSRDGERLNVDHRLRWTGEKPIEVSPWAITQLPPGGVALLPVAGVGEGSPMQSDRSLVLWPYTRLDDERISWRERSVLIDAGAGGGLKLGSGPTTRRLGYLKDGYLFTKQFEPVRGETYPDRGAIGQVYVNDHFCELESLGPMTRLEPGAEIRHREVWEVSECPHLDIALARTLAQGV